MKTLFTMLSMAALVLTATPAFAVDCETDADCMEGEVCIDLICMPDLMCEADEDCLEGEICVEGMCMPDVEPVCETDDDCLEGEICVEGECVPDMPPECDPACGEGETCVDGACVPMGGDDSCYGMCGGQAANCYCDDACFGYGDCCEDICDACPELGECCAPMCDGKECGDDGCGGSCRGCPEGESCNLEGTECLPCAGCSPWQVCAEDGSCMNPPSAGECEYGGEYIAEGCFGIDWLGCCSGDGILYYCDDQSGACPLGANCLVALDCAGQGAGCGWGDQFFMCVEGEGQPNPDGYLYCDGTGPEPDCTGKVCGSDGAGGSCGECGEGEACTEDGSACAAATCEGFCGEQAPTGCWCDVECAQWGDCCEDRCDFCPEMCEDDPCTAACTDKCDMVGDCDCGACGEGEVCQANVCVPDGPCVGDCTGKACGDDGCGMSCGECAEGEMCDMGVCTMDIEEDVVAMMCESDDDCGNDETCTDGECVTEGGGTGGDGDDDDSGGTCATGDSVPTAGLIVLFGILGLAVIRRRAIV